MVAEWVLAIATTVLAIATVGLVIFTWKLVIATRQLSEVESDREKRESRRKRAAQLERKIQLAEQIIRANLESVGGQLAAGQEPNPESALLREIAPLIQKGQDQVLPDDMDRLMLALDNALKGGARRSADQVEELMVVFHRVQERLGWDLTRWRQELAELKPELVP